MNKTNNKTLYEVLIIIITKNIKGKQFHVEIKPDQEAQTTKLEKTSWEFMNKEKTIRVIIDSEFIHIECEKYETFGILFESIELILKEFINLYPRLSKTWGFLKIHA